MPSPLGKVAEHKRGRKRPLPSAYRAATLPRGEGFCVVHCYQITQIFIDIISRILHPFNMHHPQKERIPD